MSNWLPSEQRLQFAYYIRASFGYSLRTKFAMYSMEENPVSKFSDLQKSNLFGESKIDADFWPGQRLS